MVDMSSFSVQSSLALLTENILHELLDKIKNYYTMNVYTYTIYSYGSTQLFII